MHLTEYETTVVIRPDIGGDVVEGTLDKVREVVRNGGGKLVAINHWGKKKLAYEIEKHARGIYVHTHYLGGNQLVTELERNLRISDNVLRFLTVRLAEGVSAEEREEQAYVRPQYEVEEAAGDEGAEFGAEDEFQASEDEGDREPRDSDEEAPESEEE
jgi:small subunit ribosomal protein S6